MQVTIKLYENDRFRNGRTMYTAESFTIRNTVPEVSRRPTEAILNGHFGHRVHYNYSYY